MWRSTTPLQRFEARVCKDESGCWLWLAYTNQDGYGRSRWEGRLQMAHRISWQVHRGPIPGGLEIDHLCKVRRCVNPDHLELVTHYENVQRTVNPSLAERPLAPGARLHLREICRNGHMLTPENLRISKTGHPSCRACSVESTRRWRAEKARIRNDSI